MARKVANGNAENAEKVAENARDLFNCIRHSHSRSTTKWLPPPLAGSGRGLGVVGGVYLRYPLVYARHRQLTLVLEGVFDELGVGERRFLRPACLRWLVRMCHAEAGSSWMAVGASRVVHIDWQRIKYTRRQQAAAGESEKENEGREKKEIKSKTNLSSVWEIHCCTT